MEEKCITDYKNISSNPSSLKHRLAENEIIPWGKCQYVLVGPIRFIRYVLQVMWGE